MNFWIKLLIIFGVGSLLYVNTLQGEFHLDDIPFIVKNPTIRDITDLALIGKSILGVHARHVVFFSLALNYHLHKLDVFGYHVFNTLVHLLTVVGIWQFTRLLLSTPRFAATVTPKNRENIAFCAAFLFLCHPANTQAITYITQRFASMATMFYIGALAFYIKARLDHRIHLAIPFFILAAISAVSGMLSKEIVITLPIMALAIDRLCICYQSPTPTGKKNTTSPAPIKTPLVLIAAIIGLGLIVPMLFHFNIAGIFATRMDSSSHEGDLITFNTFLLSQFRVMAIMLRLLILPFDQNLDYDFPISSGLFTPITTFISLSCLITLIIIGWKMIKRNFIVFFGILWFFVTYLPEFYPRVHVIFEHKFYLISIGFFIAFTYTLWEHPALKKNALWMFIILSVILGILTVKRNYIWRTEQSLWEDVVKKSPHKYRANLNLGNVYQLQGEYDKSIPYYDNAIAVLPYGYKAFNSRAVAYYMKGNIDQAIKDLDMSIKANPSYDDPYNNRGNLYRQRGEFQKAIEDYNTAIKVSQFAPVAYKNRADVYAKINEAEKSLSDYRSALNLDPKLRDAYNNMGNYLKELSRFPEALATYDAAIKNDPNNSADYFVGRGNVYTNMHNPKKALDEFRLALNHRPTMPEALFNAGIACANMQNFTQADEFYSLAIQAKPTLAIAYNNRGDIRRKLKRYNDAVADFVNADQITPRTEIIRRNLIQAYLENGQLDTAKREFNETLAQGVALDEKFKQWFQQNYP